MESLPRQRQKEIIHYLSLLYTPKNTNRVVLGEQIRRQLGAMRWRQRYKRYIKMYISSRPTLAPLHIGLPTLYFALDRTRRPFQLENM